MTTTQPDAAVSFDGVRKSYAAIRAVDGLSFSLPHQGVVALLGPNGSGKSTTINMLLGLLRPDEGTILVYGRTPAQAVRDGQVSAMLQQGAYPNSAKVKEVLGLARGLYPNPVPLDEVVAIAQLADLLDRRVDRLSGGQLQRVRFAFAMAGNPRLLVLDEPTVGLDVEARAHFWQSIRAYAGQDRMVLFSTHYLEEADANADRIVLMATGRLVIDSTGEEIKRVASARTISFQVGTDTPTGLADLPGVVGVEFRAGRAILRTTDSDATINTLLTDHGPVKDLELTGGTLEEAFLTLTGPGTTRNGAH